MTSFRLAFHSVNGRRIIEVMEGDEFIAGIYPATDEPRSFRIVTKHAITILPEEVVGPTNACTVKIGKP